MPVQHPSEGVPPSIPGINIVINFYSSYSAFLGQKAYFMLYLLHEGIIYWPNLNASVLLHIAPLKLNIKYRKYEDNPYPLVTLSPPGHYHFKKTELIFHPSLGNEVQLLFKPKFTAFLGFPSLKFRRYLF